MDKIFLIVNKTKQMGHGDSWPVVELAGMGMYGLELCPAFPTREVAEQFIEDHDDDISGDPEIAEFPIYPNHLYTS